MEASFEPFAASDAFFDDRKPNEVLVALGSGRELAVRDRNILSPGSSDPRVVFTITGRQERSFKSSIRKRSLNPKWYETWVFPIDLDERPLLLARVEDNDALSAADPMGVLDPIDLTEVAGRNHRYQREWFELRVDPSHPMQQQPVSGEIELSLKLRYNPALEYEPFVDEPDEFVEKANELLVAVAHGRSLAVRDKNLFSKGGGSDARAVLCFGDKQFRRTTVQKKTLYPIWREEFSFELLTPAPAVLKIRCEDYDELSSSADSMGVVDVDLTALLGDKRVRRRQWYALEKDPDTPPNLAVSGEIELILRCRYNATLDFQPFQEPSDFPNKRPNELLIAVVQGRGLAVVHDRYLSSKTGGSSDLRVILRVTSTDAECRTTRVAKKQTERPRWLETFRIPVEYADDCPQALMVQCVDQSSSAADSMGVVRVDLAPLARDQERIRKWFPLEADPDHPSEAASGELELVLRYIHNPEFCSFEPFEDEATINDHSPNELLVGLVRGRDLATKDSSHLPSPQVTFCISGNDTSYQSTVRNKTLFPIWHETFRLPIFWADENDETFVSIRCEHLDEILSQATPIGEIRIFLKSLSNQQLRRQWFPLRAHDERHNASGALELVLRLRYNPDLVVFEPFTNPDAYVGRNPNELRIGLVQGRNIATRDNNLVSYSSPSNIIQIEFTVPGSDVCAKSTIKKSTLNPAYHEVFVLAVDADDELECLRVRAKDGLTSRGGDSIGVATVNLRELANHKRMRAWHALRPEASSTTAVCGEIELVLQWWFNPEHHWSPLAGSDAHLEQRAKNELQIALIRGRKLPVMDRGPLGYSNADPFVRLTFGNQSSQSRSCTKTRNPVWKEIFSFGLDPGDDLPLELAVFDGDCLSHDDVIGYVRIENLEHELNDRSEPCRGWYDIAASEAWAGRQTCSEPSNSHYLGEIQLDLRWRHNPKRDNIYALSGSGDELLDRPRTRPNELCVFVWRARKLKMRRRPNHQDSTKHDRMRVTASVIVDNEATTVSSAPRVGASSPEWNECLALPFDAGDVARGDAKQELTVCIRHCDTPQSSRLNADLFGTVIIDLSRVLTKRISERDAAAAGNEETMTGFHPRWSWHAVQDTFSHDFESDADAEDEPHATGELKLAVGWRFNEDLAQEYLVVVEADGSSADVEPNEIHVAVVSARGVGRNADLPSSREVLEEVPPRVQASIQTVCGPSQLDEIRWTTTAKPSYRPEWGETFVIDIPEADEITPELRLSVTCWDRRSERQDNGCLGAALVPLAPLLNKERYRRWFALAPSKQQPDTKESPGWRTLDDIEDQAAPFGVVDVVLRVVASPSRAAEHLTPIGLVSRACRRFQLSPEDATLSLRHATVGRRDVCLLAALLDPDVTNEAAGVIRAPELTKADLRTCGLDGENLAILVASLHRNTTLDAIDVSGNAYSDGFRSPAAYVLSPDQHDKHRLEPIAPNPGMSALGAALVANTTLRRLNLRDARLESSGLAAVALGLRKNCSLTELKLGRNMICNVTVQGMGRFDPSGIGALATALGVHPALRHLDLSRNQICGIAASSAVVCTNKKKSLDTTKKKSSDTTALASLLESLRMNGVLCELNLTDNAILEAGGRPLLDDLTTARGRGGAGFRLVERVGGREGKRKSCLLRRLGAGDSMRPQGIHPSLTRPQGSEESPS